MKRFFFFLIPRAGGFLPLIAILFIAIFNFPQNAYAVLISFDNPITSKDGTCLIQSVVNQLTPFVAIVIAFILIIKGCQFVVASASANANKIKEVRDSIFKILIYSVIILGATTILTAVFKFVDPLFTFPQTCNSQRP